MDKVELQGEVSLYSGELLLSCPQCPSLSGLTLLQCYPPSTEGAVLQPWSTTCTMGAVCTLLERMEMETKPWGPLCPLLHHFCLQIKAWAFC